VLVGDGVAKPSEPSEVRREEHYLEIISKYRDLKRSCPKSEAGEKRGKKK